MSGFMSNKKASFVKNEGHNQENLFALERNGNVIKGRSKIDVIVNNDNYQLKRGKRYQWALYSNLNKINSIPYLNMNFLNLLKNENLQDRNKRIKIQKKLMCECVSILQDKKKLKKFLDFMIYDNIDNLLHRFLFDDCVFYSKKSDFLNDLLECDVVSSRGNRKILLKKKLNIIEIEVRSDKKSILMVSTSKNIRKIILNNGKYLMEYI